VPRDCGGGGCDGVEPDSAAIAGRKIVAFGKL
jgi:hypothetical protein